MRWWSNNSTDCQVVCSQLWRAKFSVWGNMGFHKWGYPNSWMIYNGKSQPKMDDLGVPLFQETPKWWIHSPFAIEIGLSKSQRFILGSVSSFSGQMVLAPTFSWAFSTSWPTPSACGASLSQSAAIQIRDNQSVRGLSLVFHRKKCDNSGGFAGSLVCLLGIVQGDCPKRGSF